MVHYNSIGCNNYLRESMTFKGVALMAPPPTSTPENNPKRKIGFVVVPR